MNRKFPFKENGEIDLVQLDKDVDWDNPTEIEKVMFSVGKPNHSRLTKEVKADPNLAVLKWAGGHTLLHLACCNCQKELAEILVRFGADVNAYDGFNAPLHEAVESNCLEIVQLLLESGVVVDTTDRSGTTALHKACLQGNLAIVQLLLDHGVSLNVKDDSGKTALDLAVMRCHPDVSRRLLQHGAVSEDPETLKRIKRLERKGRW